MFQSRYASAVKRDDRCVMQVYKDKPSSLTCVLCSVFWLDDNMVGINHTLRRRYEAKGMLLEYYRIRMIDEVSRLARPNAKVATLIAKARNVQDGVAGSLVISRKI
jgi:hypothetical protein